MSPNNPTRPGQIDTPLAVGQRLRELVQEGHRVANQVVSQIEQPPKLNQAACRQLDQQVARLGADLGLLVMQLKTLEWQNQQESDNSG